MIIDGYCNTDKKNRLENAISYITNHEYKYFLNKKNVVGVGNGYKIKNGFNTHERCIKVFVIKKVPKCGLIYNDRIPNKFKGILIDVVESGVFRSASLKNRIRPVKPGYSISPNLCLSDGTLGCLVTNGVSKFILSSNHILAEENTLDIGFSIVQPGYQYHGRDPADTIATLYKYIPLKFSHGDTHLINFSDAAIAVAVKSNIVTNEIAYIGKVNCVKSPKLNSNVKKVGSTTELTNGIVESTSTTVILEYASGRECLFKEVILTTKMGEPGDSGSLLVNENRCGIGLLFGESVNNTLYSRLDITLDQLDVKLLT